MLSSKEEVMANTRYIRAGLTLIEVLVVIIIVAVLMTAVGATLVDTQNAWNAMYKRSNSGPTMDAVITNKEFDRAIRKATTKQCDIDGDRTKTSGTASVRVYYFKDPVTSTYYDGYSQFYYVAAEKRLKVDEGNATLTAGVYAPSGNATATRILAENVVGCAFGVSGDAVSMLVRLDAGQNTDVKDGNVKMTVACSAVRHNQ
jgi:prepilin-type N-terminal cleavage/methylation domain-containing protein